MIHWQQFEQSLQFDPKGWMSRLNCPFSLWLNLIVWFSLHASVIEMGHGGLWRLVVNCQTSFPRPDLRIEAKWGFCGKSTNCQLMSSTPANQRASCQDLMLQSKIEHCCRCWQMAFWELWHLNLENCYLVTVKHDPWVYTLDNFEIGLGIELVLQEWKWVKSASQYPMKFLPSNITEQHFFETNLINKRHTFLKLPKEQCYMLRIDFLSIHWCLA